MKAWQFAAGNGPAARLVALPFPSLHRDGGWIDPMPYRLQASGELPMPKQNLSHSSGLRTICLSDGDHPELFAGDGQTLNFVIAGRLSLSGSDGAATTLEPGDMLLAYGPAAAKSVARAAGACRLVQLGIGAEWPGADAEPQDNGAIMPRLGAEPNLRRMDKQADDRTWFSDLANLFPDRANTWSAVTPVLGFRFLRFPDQAFIDWHPEVVNNLAIFLSGDMEIEIGGGANDGGPVPIDHFLAGDILLAADRTGEGHIDRMHGIIHLALIVIEDQYLWPIKNLTRRIMMPVDSSVEKLVYEHEQIRQLTKLINTYHQRADDFDWDGWAATFVDDASFFFEHGFGQMTGREGIKEICKSSMDPFYELMQHIMINLDFELTGPDTATGRANLIFTAVPDETKRETFYQSGGRYRWDFKKTADGWRIANAYLDFLWNNGQDADNVFETKDA